MNSTTPPTFQSVDSMRVVKFERYGEPEVLQFEEVGHQTPAENEVLIRVKAIGLNRAESMWRHGEYVEPVNLPARLGYESAGIVTAVGAKVSHVQPGDAVSTIPSFSLNDYGMYGEEVLAPAHAVVKHLSTLSFEEAVSIWNPYITPYGALIATGLLKSSDTVLINAASSSVGVGTIQMVNMMGATSVALTRTHEKRQQLLDAGAHYVIATEEQDLVAEVMKITEGKGASIIFEPVGGPNFPTLISSLAVGGTVFIYGALSPQVTPLPILEVIAKKPIIRGYNLFETTTDPERQKKAVDFITQGLQSGALKPLIEKTFTFDEIIQAHHYLEKSQHIGRIVVVVD